MTPAGLGANPHGRASITVCQLPRSMACWVMACGAPCLDLEADALARIANWPLGPGPLEKKRRSLLMMQTCKTAIPRTKDSFCLKLPQDTFAQSFERLCIASPVVGAV